VSRKNNKLSLQLEINFIPKKKYKPDSSLESGLYEVPPDPPVRAKLSAPAIGHAEHVLSDRYTEMEFVNEVWGVLIFRTKIHRERFWAYVHRVNGDRLEVNLRHR
jgi:hypothetical protein